MGTNTAFIHHVYFLRLAQGQSCIFQTSFTLAITFQWLVIELSYITGLVFVVRPFLCWKRQGHLSRSRSNFKVTFYLKKMAIVGAFMFHKHIMFFNSTENFVGK